MKGILFSTQNKPFFLKAPAYFALLSASLTAGATLMGLLFRALGFPETNIVIIYILAVLLTARFTPGYGWGIAAAFVATFTYNFFFTVPLYSFAVSDSSYIVTFATMTVAASITSALTSKAKASEEEARRREAEVLMLYSFTNRLSNAFTPHEIASVAVNTIHSFWGWQAACLCFDGKGRAEDSYIQQVGEDAPAWRKTEEPEQIGEAMLRLRSSCLAGEEFFDWPVYSTKKLLAVIRIPASDARAMDGGQRQALHSVIKGVALAMDRYGNARARLKSEETAAQERYRSNLLRAISHDLRTPQAGIMGTAEILIEQERNDSTKAALASAIYSDAQWLCDIVENVLSLTRIQSGASVISYEHAALEEIVEVALNHVKRRLRGHKLTVRLPDELLMVRADSRLIQQVLVNLLDNAAKHTPPGKAIKISAARDEDGGLVYVTVEDEGDGIPPEDLPHIFEMFYTSKKHSADAQKGIGLGLPICEEVIKAHGGAVAAENINGGGARFIFTLPLAKDGQNDKTHSDH